MYEPDNKLDPPLPKEIVLQNVDCHTENFAPNNLQI